MFENIRVTLWDIFTFFLTGFLAFTLTIGFCITSGSLSTSAIVSQINGFNASITLVAAPLAFALLGMVIEPFANYTDKFLITPVWRRLSRPKENHKNEEEILAKEIRTKYFGSLNGRIEDPYALCKEYVETKQLSTTFMVYLSRYGFYRNCVFLSLLFGIATVVEVRFWWEGALVGVLCFLSVVVFKRRAEDFYSYMAPAVYRAFLIDKLKWSGAEDV